MYVRISLGFSLFLRGFVCVWHGTVVGNGRRQVMCIILFQILFNTTHSVTSQAQKNLMRLKNQKKKKKSPMQPPPPPKPSPPIPPPPHPPPLFLLFRPQTKIKSHRLSLLDLILPSCIIRISPISSQLSSLLLHPPPFLSTTYILATLHFIICSPFSS